MKKGISFYRELVANCTKEIRERLCQAQPAGYIGEAKDIANVVPFVASGDAGYLTGGTILVDGVISRSL